MAFRRSVYSSFIGLQIYKYIQRHKPPMRLESHEWSRVHQINEPSDSLKAEMQMIIQVMLCNLPKYQVSSSTVQHSEDGFCHEIGNQLCRRWRSALTVAWARTCVGCPWLPMPAWGEVRRPPQLETFYHDGNNHPDREKSVFSVTIGRWKCI